MTQPPTESFGNMEIQEQERPREKICISISEGCIRHYNEEPEIEEQFILRLPENEAKVVHDALETGSLEERLTIFMEKNQRDAIVTLDGKEMVGKVFDLPTIIESQKLADESTLFKTADISQILICKNKEHESDLDASSGSDNGKKLHSTWYNKGDEYKFSEGICPPFKNVRKKRFRKVQLEENFDPDVDRAVKVLLRADGAADSVRYEIAYENENDSEGETLIENVENPSAIEDKSSITNDLNEVHVFGENVSFSSSDDDSADFYNNEACRTSSNSSDLDSDFDSDIGNIENYDLDTLTEEQKQHLAQLKEIDWCLSLFDYRKSPERPVPRVTRGRGSGRGRGRPRVRSQSPKPQSYKPKTNVSKPIRVSRGRRGRPPGRGRGRSAASGLPSASIFGSGAVVNMETEVY